jgi:DNA-binding MarR family transcriptional regulator
VPKHDELVGHLLWELSTRMSLLDVAFEGSPLSRPSVGMLNVIATSPGIGIAEITRHALKTQQAVSQVVARLESLGLVERRLVGKRTIGLYLTPAGTRAHHEGLAAEAAFERTMAAAFGRERYERLRKVLLDARPVLVELAAQRATGGERTPARAKARRR